ncbi:MAG: histidinol-phosphate transaminase [Armatimonadetes bacterium]|nr:histidinol-phosphate transaminase [Armatimonadota bacterium]
MTPRLCREGILKLRPYIPGKPIEEVQREYGLTDIIKLASNENPLGPSHKAVESMKSACERVGLYPDGSCFALRQAVAEHLGVEPDYLSFGAGSDECIHEIGVAFLEDGDDVVQADPTFSQYETAATLMECPCRMIPLNSYSYDVDAMADRITERTKLVFVANPNNPTGTMVTHTQVERLLDRLPERAILVLDEAYHEYNVDRPDFPKALPWVLEGRNIVLLRTFSKIYGLAGLRLGYAIAKPEIIRFMEQVRLPFNVNSVAQAGAIAALADQEHVEKSRKLNAEGKHYFYSEFDRLGLPYAPSDANFVWVDLKKDSRWVFGELLKRGVIIRTGDIFGCPTYARVTIGLPEENQRFIGALEEVLA